ncbi:calcium-binding protein [Thetidibacter halocola]|uniref:Calcium-binding protein n=1 Tax=Thetidibacter halocola TaxID=2827239 RepID=A0A8J7WK23_9RHOB|nr:calcium-binding protein [Thetidibacter halocola]
MANFSLSHTGSAGTGWRVNAEQFAANALHGVNFQSGASFAPTDDFAAAVEAVGVRHLRFPGGHVENTIDVTRLENGRLRAEIRDFLDWCVANSSPGHEFQVTFVLPTKVNYTQKQIADFVHLLMSEYGDVISAFEIGNEYSIGDKETNANRSIHPEYIPGSDHIAAMNEAEYGIAANRTILGVQDALDRLAVTHRAEGWDPAILVQMSEPSGKASSYKGSGNYDLANEAIVSMLSARAIAAIDGTVAHYYYNKGHEDDPAFAHDWTEIRRLDERLANFNEHLGKQVDLYITEWNVLTSNYDQLGLVGASVILEMFESMVRMGVKDAHVWPLQHRTGNTMAGDRMDGEADLSITGTALKMMADRLYPEQSETGRTVRFESMDSRWSGAAAAVEINHYASVYGDVLYISLRDDAPGSVTLDLSRLLTGAADAELRQLGIAPGSSDGFSDFAHDNGLNRISKRYIDQAELNELSRLAFFDPNNPNHVDYRNGAIRTYLPDPDTIFPLVANPRQIEDYYFAGEADVRAQLRDITGRLGGDGRAVLQMRPYEVVEVTIDRAWQQTGGNGNDSLLGGSGLDVLSGLGGNDTLRGGERDDTLLGGTGDDLLLGGSGDDLLDGGGGTDTLLGHDGNDTIRTGSGQSRVDGGAGTDLLEIAANRAEMTFVHEGGVLVARGASHVIRIEGIETVRFQNGVVALSDLVNVPPLSEPPPPDDPTPPPTGTNRLVTGTDGADRLTGGTGNDTIRAMAGNDLVHLRQGNDLFEEAATSFTSDNDTVFGGHGDDVMRGLGGNDVYYGEWGNDRLTGGAGADRLFGGDGSDTIEGGAGNDHVYGGRHNDVLRGLDGLDSIVGAGGDDWIQGGAGGDTLRGGAGTDTIEGGDGRDLVWLGGGNDLYTDTDQDGVDGRDTVYGNGGNDRIATGGGNDLIYGHRGSDTLLGGAGDDMLFGGDQDDRLEGGTGHDTVVGGNGRDLVFMEDGDDVWLDNDQLEFGNDTVFGGAGEDVFYSRRGDDRLTGGAGADTFVFAAQIDRDVITDFQVGIDQLRIDTGLWGGPLTEARLEAISTVVGGNLVLDFGGGHSLTLQGVTETDSLWQDIVLA